LFSKIISKCILRYTNLKPVSVDTLRCNIESVTRAVLTIVGEEMPDLFGLMLDGWSNGSEQYLAVFGCYLVGGERRHPLLSMTPVVQEADDDHSADTHLRAIATFLPFFGKTLSQCLFIVGDNCGVNKRLANLMGVPLVGCASHRLNLAVKSILAPYEEDLEAVQSVMKKLRTLNGAAKLR
jgi:hypothetical protein